MQTGKKLKNNFKMSNEISFTNDKSIRTLLAFAVPLMLTGILQLLYNATDVIVVGRFAGKESLAAVGAGGVILTLLTNITLGMSAGVTALMANAFGGGDRKFIERATHTAVMMSIIGGIALGIVGFIFAEDILKAIDTPEDVLKKAAIYMRIFSIGIPATALYNFGAAILRAVGDTKKPLHFLIISGIIHVILNLFFVPVCNLDVSGVAVATVISQYFSAYMLIKTLAKTDAPYKLVIRKLCIRKEEMLKIIKIGLPAGIQGAVFSLSSITVQSAVNTLGKDVIAGNSAAANIEGFVYTIMNALHHTAITYTAQNYGAKNIKMLNSGFYRCMGIVTAVGLIAGGAASLFAAPLLSLYSADSAVVSAGALRLRITCSTYFLCGIMEVMSGTLRGLGRSFTAMVITLLSACGIRIVWVYTIFKEIGSATCVYCVFPVSYIIADIALLVVYKYIMSNLYAGYKNLLIKNGHKFKNRPVNKSQALK